MPPDKGGMARITTIIIMVLTGVLALSASLSTPGEQVQGEPEQAPRTETETPQQTTLTAQQQELIDLAVGRFELQGLELPEINYVFHPDLQTCNGHKGMYHKTTRTLEMCSMDPHTMLHELAHAWANEHLTEAARNDFVALRNLDSWNNHDHAWERRGTEHMAETIAWALSENPNHVKWVETKPDGTTHTSHRILSINVAVDTLVDNFKLITGMDPIFRDPSQWAVQAPTSTEASPEITRIGN